MVPICVVMLSLFLSAIVLGDACGQRQPAPLAEAVINLDDAHDQAAGAQAMYTIPESSALIVDAGGYTIKVPPQLGIEEPNAIHIIHGKAEYYRASWNGRGKIVLDRKTLESLRGPKLFPGFKANGTYVLAIGYERRSGPDQKLNFDALWAGMVEVR